MSEIKPALTAEEWAGFLGDITTPVGWLEGGCKWSRGEGDGHDGAAAMLLHDQPFGFTWDDVDMLKMSARTVLGAMEHKALLSIADRIEALLPPEERRLTTTIQDIRRIES